MCRSVAKPCEVLAVELLPCLLPLSSLAAQSPRLISDLALAQNISARVPSKPGLDSFAWEPAGPPGTDAAPCQDSASGSDPGEDY